MSRTLSAIDLNVPKPIGKLDAAVNPSNNELVVKKRDITKQAQSQEQRSPHHKTAVSKQLFASHEKDKSLSKSLLKKRAIERQQRKTERGAGDAQDVVLAGPGVRPKKVSDMFCESLFYKLRKQSK